MLKRKIDQSTINEDEYSDINETEDELDILLKTMGNIETNKDENIKSEIVQYFDEKTDTHNTHNTYNTYSTQDFRGKTYVYNAYKLKKDVCFQDYEKETVEKNIEDSSKRFIKKDCDLKKQWILSQHYHSCNASLNLRDLYTYFVKKKTDIFYYIDRPIDLIDEVYDISISIDISREIFIKQSYFKYELSKNLAKKLRDQVKTGVINSSIFLNCSINYKDLGKSIGGHHISFLVTKTDINKIKFEIIDTGCNYENKEKFMETILTIYKNDVGESNEDIEIFIIFSFEEFLKEKYRINSLGEEIPENELEILCNKNLQTEEKYLFGYGFCVSWGLFFMIEIFFKGKTIYDIYDMIYRMEDQERAKFIYVWYDNFYSKMRSEIPEEWQSLR